MEPGLNWISIQIEQSVTQGFTNVMYKKHLNCQNGNLLTAETESDLRIAHFSEARLGQLFVLVATQPKDSNLILLIRSKVTLSL